MERPFLTANSPLIVDDALYGYSHRNSVGEHEIPKRPRPETATASAELLYPAAKPA